MSRLLLHGSEVSSIFELIGTNENDITKSIAWSFAECPQFLVRVIQFLFDDTDVDEDNISIIYQKYDDETGITDLEITDENNFYVIIEAKRGWIIPGQEQLERYSGREEFVKSTVVNKALVSTSTDVQGILSGVCFTFSNDCYELASTDGNRLSQIKFATQIGQEGQFVIPKKILQDVIRNVGEDVSIFLNDKTVVFQTGTCLFRQNLLTGKFPDYVKLLPSTFEHRAIVDRNDLLHSLDRVAVMCDEKSNLTIFNFKDGELHLNTASKNGTAEDTLEISFDGELKIAFNYRFILIISNYSIDFFYKRFN